MGERGHCVEGFLIGVPPARINLMRVFTLTILIFLTACMEDGGFMKIRNLCLPNKIIEEIDIPSWIPENLPDGDGVSIILNNDLFSGVSGYVPLSVKGGEIPNRIFISDWGNWEIMRPDQYDAKLVMRDDLARKIEGSPYTLFFRSEEKNYFLVVLLETVKGEVDLPSSRRIAYCRADGIYDGSIPNKLLGVCDRVFLQGEASIRYRFMIQNINHVMEMDDVISTYLKSFPCERK